MSSLVALYRPQPLGLKMHTKFADVKNGKDQKPSASSGHAQTEP